MAQSYLNTATQNGNFEDLVNFITRVAYEETPFLSKAGRTKAKGIKHEWMTQSLRAGAANARAEGYSPSFAAGDITARARKSNQCQILAQPFSVSGTQEVVDKAGLGQSSEYENQRMLKSKEVALDTDYVLLNGTAVTRDADAGTAGQLDGLFAWLDTADGAAATDAGGASLQPDLYNALTQTIAENGGNPDTVLCAGFNRRMISSWTTNIRRMEDSKQFTNTISVYEGDFGKQAVLFDKHCPAASIAIIEMKYFKVAYLRPLEHKELGIDGDLRKGYVLSELTLEALAPASSGKITNLSVTGA